METIKVPNLDDLPESLAPIRSLFKAVDDGFEYTPPKVEDVSGLKSALAKLKREGAAQKEQYDALRARLVVDGEDLSGEETLAELLALRKKQLEGDDKEVVPRTELARVKRETEEAIGKKYKTELETVKTENTGLAARLNRVLVHDGLRAASLKIIGLKKGAIDEILESKAVEKFCKVVDNDQAVGVNGEGEEVSLSEWLAEYVAVRAGLYVEESTGSETVLDADGKPRKGVATTKLWQDMTEKERVQFYSKHGKDAGVAKMLADRAKRKLQAA